MDQILELKATLLASDDLRQPDNLQEQLMHVSGLDEDANKSLMSMLQVCCQNNFCSLFKKRLNA